MPIAAEVLGQLYREHAPALRLYARQWPVQSEDLVHEAFIKLAQQPQVPENVTPWLYRVVRNAALQAARSAARRRQRESAVSTPEAWFATVDDQLDAREAVRQLAALPLELREIIVARIWGGLTFDEIAALVGCSLPTAHRHYHAGLAALRERLTASCTNSTHSPTT